MSTTPYSYHLYHKQTGKHYYGIRFAKNCNPSDLWVNYFSSSKVIKAMIIVYGKDSFTITVRKIFNDSAAALLWEHRVLTKLDAASRDDWINRHNGGKKFRGPICHSDDTKKLLRKKITGMKRSADTKQKHSINAKVREQNKRDNNWSMPKESMIQMVHTKAARIASGEINPYSEERNSKISKSKTGTKRQYLADGSFIMIKV